MKGRLTRARELLLSAEPNDAELLAMEFHTLRREVTAMGLAEAGRLALEAEEAARAGGEAAPLARVACGRFLWRIETLIEQIELGAR
jgi:hypothetical protein